MLLRILLIVCLVAPAHAAAQSFAPAGWTDGIKLNELPDSNPDPRIVEVALAAKIAEVEVAPGKRVRAWTYNGGLPGPLIKASVGDRVIVRRLGMGAFRPLPHWLGALEERLAIASLVSLESGFGFWLDLDRLARMDAEVGV